MPSHSMNSSFDDGLHRFPYGGQPFSSTPVVKVGADLYFLPVSPIGLLASVRPRMEHLLSRDHAVHSRYLDLRGRFDEEESTRILKKMLPGAASWTGIGWRGSETEGELDGLVACDDLALRIQAKSGRVDDSDPARSTRPHEVELEETHRSGIGAAPAFS